MAEQTVVRRQLLTEQVVRALETYIVENALQPGSPLPSTIELTQRFNVSRTVIREALADLAGRGIIDRAQGRGSRVAEPNGSQLHELLAFRVRGGHIDAKSVMEFRQLLEVRSALLAAERATAKERALLEEKFERIAAATNDEEFELADLAFHRSIAAASGNPLILLVTDALTELLQGVHHISTAGRRRLGNDLAEVIEDHRHILEAILKGSGAEAAMAMDHHLQATIQDLKGAIPLEEAPEDIPRLGRLSQDGSEDGSL